MRQAGIIAAAGLISLDDCIMQIKKDHNNAKVLAEGLNKIKGLSVQLNLVQTNIIFLN